MYRAQTLIKHGLYYGFGVWSRPKRLGVCGIALPPEGGKSVVEAGKRTPSTAEEGGARVVFWPKSGTACASGRAVAATAGWAGVA